MTWEPISPAAPVTRTSIFGDIEGGLIRRELDLGHLVAHPYKIHDSPKDSRVDGSSYPTVPHTGPVRSDGGCGDNYPLPTLSNSRIRLCPLNSFRRCGTSLHLPPIDHVRAGGKSQPAARTYTIERRYPVAWLGLTEPRTTLEESI
jgi:hypothetical protein